MDRRKFIGAGSLMGLSALVLPEVNASVAKQVKVFEYTFLKSIEPKPDNLIKFILANWFAMDKIAVKQGLMINYSLFESPDESADASSWNVVVVVGYPTENGYSAIAPEFEKIRQKHKKVLIEGKDLRDLGHIVGSRKLFPRG